MDFPEEDSGAGSTIWMSNPGQLSIVENDLA